MTLTRGHIYLEELLDQLSRDCRVPLSVDESRGPVSGIRLTVCAKDRRLREILDGLAILLTHPQDRWEWRRKTRESYVLFHQRPPGEAAGLARRELLDRFRDGLRRFGEIARLPEPQRSARAAGQPELYWSGLLVTGRPDVLASLEPHEMGSLLNGNFVPVNPARLTPLGRQGLTLGVRPLPPESEATTQPGVYLEWDPEETGPWLMLRNQFNMASGVFGGFNWDSRWLEERAKGWTHQAAPEVQELGGRRARGGPAAGMRIGPGPLSDWARRVARAHAVDYLIDPVLPAEWHGGRWLGRDAEQSTRHIVLAAGLTWRRAGHLNLLRHRTSIVAPRSHLVTWSLVRALRRTAERNEGFLELEGLAALSGLSNEQVAGLAPEFPDATISEVGGWHSVLAFARNLDRRSARRLGEAEGLPLPEAGLVARAALAEGSDPQDLRGIQLIERDPRRAMVSLRVEAKRFQDREMVGERGRATPGKTGEVGGRQLVWEVRIPEGPPHVRTFRMRPRNRVEEDPPLEP